MVEHDDAIDDAHQKPHDVLDPDDGDPELCADRLQHQGGVLHLGMIEPAEALIGEKKARPRRERARKLELFQSGRAQAFGSSGVGQTDHLEGGLRSPARLALGDPDGAAVVCGKHDILHEGEAAKRARDLEGAGKAHAAHFMGWQPTDLLAFEADRAGGRAHRPGDQVEGRALA